ncbi:MAG TPA: hypothetical protein PLY94_07495, partial [Gemmatimonadaceae bacterium]|nr:hypothetical protein [Gemmatimonadaceae bacterium]
MRFRSLLAFAALALAACGEDHAEIVQLRTSCGDGDVAACFRLGDRFRTGDHILRDYSEARRLFTSACDGRVGEACASLGTMELRGLGARRDSAQARALFE